MKFLLDADDIEQEEIAPGITIRVMSGEDHMMGLVQVAPHAELPRHVHEHEQSGFVMQGAVVFVIDGKTQTVRQGESYLVPAGVAFSLVGSDELSVFLGIFDGHEVPTINEYAKDKGAL